MGSDFRRVAIVNRGEAAMRFINAVREFNDENGSELRTIALYTDPDRKAMFVREADEGYDLGPALGASPAGGARRCAYLDYERVCLALRETGADAVWAGWGFVAEDADFVELLETLGIVFIGPRSAAMRQLSDKIAAKLLAERVGVPVVPWSGGPVADLAQARSAAERLGYPLMIKASAGGGGRGIRRVAAAAELEDALVIARSEARKAFGDGSVFLERRLEGVRHVEVQILADHHGTTWGVGTRDCTIQRRHQKILEEAPAEALCAERDAEVRRAAVRVCAAAGYTSTGTVEFLFDPKGDAFFFMEVNARLQVEHTVTEVTTGLDLVKLQLHVAREGRLRGDPPAATGHAIEVRLNAEDPDDAFAPAPGTFALFRLPTGPGLRVDRGVTEGDTVAPEFDSMVAKVIAHGRSRQEALARLHRALAGASIVIEGGATNRAFLLGLLERPEVRSGDVDTGWLERTMAAGPVARPHGAIALVQAAVEVYEAEHALEQAAFYATAARLRPELRAEVGRTMEFRHEGRSYRAKVLKRGSRDYRVELDDRRLDVQVEPLGRFESWLTASGRRYRVVSVVQGAHHLVEVEGVAHRFSRDDLGLLRATSPAVVVKVAVAPGDVVQAGAPLLVLEAMKMETTLAAPFAGRVRRVLVVKNVQVAPGAPLLQLDPEAEPEEEAGARLVLPGAEAARGPLPDAGLRTLEDLRRLVLGFDVEPAEARKLTETYVRLAREDAASDGEGDRREDEILGIFGDVASLFRRRAAPDEGEEAYALSSGEYFLTYLRNVEVPDPGLPAAFLDKVRCAVARHGVTSLEPSPALRDALLWIWKARQRAEQQIPAIIAILDRRAARALARAEEPDPAFVATLDRLIAAAEGRHASLADVAREVRYRVFDQPLYERARRRAYEHAERDLAQLQGDPDGPDRDALVASLVACPQPLFGLLAGRFEQETRPMRRLMIEVMTRRYYRIRELERIRTWDVRGWVGAAAEYEHEGRRVHLIATHLVETVLDARFPEAARRLRGLVGG
ncbi:MAG TPA: biotin carboxylase N-terminal domain-containing protein, partial [Vicinamibacteria bacterium]|nr:biotin carboxylase N-terminal domain-containing protein [Vicinamibacteria bacterium]